MNVKLFINTLRYRLSIMNISFHRKIKIGKRSRRGRRNDDSDINELLTGSLSELFSAEGKTGKIDENTNHTIESTDRELSEDDNSDCQGNNLRKIISFDQDENTGTSVIDIEEEDGSDDSIRFRDVFPDYRDENDSLEEREASFAQVLCDLDMRDLRKEQRKKVIKAFFGPMKSLVKKPVKIPRRNSPRNFTGVNFQSRRKQITFSETPTHIVDDVEEEIYDKECSKEYTESTWYNDEEYDSMKQEVLKTMQRIVRCRTKKRDFAETNRQTARGLELVTREMIVQRKLYKVASRHVVFDEQEEQRLAHSNDPERIRKLYIESTKKARATALEYGWKDQEAVHVLNESSFCIDEERT